MSGTFGTIEVIDPENGQMSVINALESNETFTDLVSDSKINPIPMG